MMTMLKQVVGKIDKSLTYYIGIADAIVLRRKVSALELQMAIRDSQIKFLETKNAKLNKDVADYRRSIATLELKVKLQELREEKEDLCRS